MSDLITVLPDFQSASFTHLLPSLAKKLITTSDLLTLDASDIAKRAQLPPTEVAKLCNAVLEALQKQLSPHSSTTDASFSFFNGVLHEKGKPSWQAMSTLDESLDAALGGGIPAGFVTEVTGERCGC